MGTGQATAARLHKGSPRWAVALTGGFLVGGAIGHSCRGARGRSKRA